MEIRDRYRDDIPVHEMVHGMGILRFVLQFSPSDTVISTRLSDSAFILIPKLGNH